VETFYFLAGAAVGCTLLVAGIQTICNNLLELAEIPLFHLLQSLKEKDNKTFFKGFMVSALSGSTMTTMSTLLGLVNAGLVKSRAGLLFMAGSHLGPVILLFGISFLSFKSALVFLSAALIAQVLVRSRYGLWFQNSYGLLFGFGLVSLGQYFLSDGLKFFSGFDQAFLGSSLDGPYFLSLITGIAVGGILSFVFRSSVVTILLLMLIHDSARFNLGLLLPAVIGVHALSFWPIYRLGSRGNRSAARVALGHGFMSAIGLIIGSVALIFLPWNYADSNGYLIFLFFVALKIISGTVFMIFFKPIRLSIKKRYPDTPDKSLVELENLGRSQDMVPAMSLIQSSLHLNKFKNIVDRLFRLTEQYLIDGEASGRTMAKIKDYERITDNMHREIVRFLNQLIEKSLTYNQAQTVQAHLRIAESLESIADYLDKVASYNTRYLQGGGKSDWRQEFVAFYRQVKDFYWEVSQSLPLLPEKDPKEIQIQAQKLKIAAESLREEHLKRFEEFSGDPMNLMTYSDMVVCMRKIRGHGLKLYHELL
jgi:phosphate:Na+ symporter